MEYVIDGDRVVATVADGEGDRVAKDGQRIAVVDRTSNWPRAYRNAMNEVGDALASIRDSAALQDLPSVNHAEHVLGQFLTEIRERLQMDRRPKLTGGDEDDRPDTRGC